jgi:hypothetical protein
MMDQIGLSSGKEFLFIINKIKIFISDSSSATRIDEICTIIDTFCLTYCQLTATDIETMNLVKIFPHIQAFLIENNRLKQLIDQIEVRRNTLNCKISSFFFQSSEDLDYISKLQTYLTKIEDNRNATEKSNIIMSNHFQNKSNLYLLEKDSKRLSVRVSRE